MLIAASYHWYRRFYRCRRNFAVAARFHYRMFDAALFSMLPYARCPRFLSFGEAMSTQWSMTIALKQFVNWESMLEANSFRLQRGQSESKVIAEDFLFPAAALDWVVKSTERIEKVNKTLCRTRQFGERPLQLNQRLESAFLPNSQNRIERRITATHRQTLRDDARMFLNDRNYYSSVAIGSNCPWGSHLPLINAIVRDQL